MAYRVYLTDDDRFLISLYSAKFRSAGNEVESFSSAEDLLQRLRKDAKGKQAAPDAVLLDLIMPGVDGFSAIETIRKESLAKGAKLIVLSNEGQDAEIAHAKALGADEYIVKSSAIPSEVLAEVDRVLGAKEAVPS